MQTEFYSKQRGADAFGLPPHIRPRFDIRRPPADIASNAACWDYWAPEPSGDPAADFQLGADIALECLCDEEPEIARGLIAYALAAMRDKAAWGDIESGFVSLIGLVALGGAKPCEITRPTELSDPQWTGFHLGAADALSDTDQSFGEHTRITDRIGLAVLSREYTPEFAGYATAIISAATACGEH